MSRRVAHNDVRHDLRAAGRYADGVGGVPVWVAWTNSIARAVLGGMDPGAPGFARARRPHV